MAKKDGAIEIEGSLCAAAKRDGSATFGIDVRPPGLLYASVLMCPTLGGAVASFDAKAALALPGVKAVIAVPGLRGGTAGVAAIAGTPWQAISAAKAVVVQWDHGVNAQLNSADITTLLKQKLAEDDGFGYYSQGDAAAALKGAAKTLTAEYQAPLLAHATLLTPQGKYLADFFIVAQNGTVRASATESSWRRARLSTALS